jgi:uncharacterized heparinase superfamily protein
MATLLHQPQSKTQNNNGNDEKEISHEPKCNATRTEHYLCHLCVVLHEVHMANAGHRNA